MRGDRARRARWAVYLAAAAAAAALIGPYLVLVLLACGLIELVLQRRPAVTAGLHWMPLAALAPKAVAVGGLGALCWTAFKVGALSYGGGFVIIPLMQGDAVDTYHWMTNARVPQRRRARPGHARPRRRDDRRRGLCRARARRRPARRGGRLRAVLLVHPARRRALPAAAREPSGARVPRRCGPGRDRRDPGRRDHADARTARDLAVRRADCRRDRVARPQAGRRGDAARAPARSASWSHSQAGRCRKNCPMATFVLVHGAWSGAHGFRHVRRSCGRPGTRCSRRA